MGTHPGNLSAARGKNPWSVQLRVLNSHRRMLSCKTSIDFLRSLIIYECARSEYLTISIFFLSTKPQKFKECIQFDIIKLKIHRKNQRLMNEICVLLINVEV